MKGIKQIFFCCLTTVMACMHTAYADDSADAIARAASRRDATTTVTRQQSTTENQTARINTASGISRATNTSSHTTSNTRTRSSTNTRDNAVIRDVSARSATNPTDKGVSARTTSTVLPRASSVGAPNVVSTPSRAAISHTSTATPVSRSNVASQSHSGISRSSVGTISRGAINMPSRTNSTASSNTILRGRAATTTASARVSRASITADEIINRDYTSCREVFYSCMDEFCANKDSQLKRCACSSRVNEFDDIKEQLTAAEDKLLDFNQRLLTVNMDKEDAEAIFTPTEGELAFQQDDNSQSKKLLDEIAEKLNDTFDTESYNANLAPISLSLNVDAAFDTVDSLAGASTTLRSGPELYASALPICREMAMEVCTADELNIVESGYQMAIEQDCNTVAKAYQTQQDLAREKIREGSALLDISRLDIYQQRNSDDILTCKRKMLDMLTNTAVCGEGLQKCLDITGQYIDPSTGEAILTSNLINLSNLITRPESGQSWTTAPGNEKFVSYLTSKKMFLESATDKCQDIADSVWDGFIEDALAQIKLAQEEKMEEVRQSCTTLTAQCLSNAADSLEDFDARALSIFGVAADKTVKQMCSEVQTACTALLDTVDGGTEWNAGITEIATDKTYETILQTCREVGRACIIQSCKSISGNFGLCENIQTSVNRKAIINRTACWGEVLNCVADAGIDSVNKITELRFADGTLDGNYTFYETLYGQYDITDVTSDNITRPDAPCILTKDGNCIYDICASECGFDGTQYTKNTSDECHVCRLAERVWGNCEAHPTTSLNAKESHNKIKLPVSTVLGQSQETLLSWFAKNTNTEDESDSCRDTSCGPGFAPIWDPNKKTTVCVSEDNFSGDNQLCPANTFWQFNVGNYTNCCKSGNSFGGRDAFGNCCAIGNTINGFQGLNWGATAPYAGGGDKNGTIPDMGIGNVFAGKETPASGLCLSPNAQFVIAYQPEFTQYYGTGLSFVFCNGGSVSGTETNDSYPNGQEVSCSSSYILINQSGQYMSPLYNFSDNGLTPTPDYKQYVTNSYQTQEEEICKKIFNEADGWTWATNNNTTCPAPANWSISY